MLFGRYSARSAARDHLWSTAKHSIPGEEFMGSAKFCKGLVTALSLTLLFFALTGLGGAQEAGNTVPTLINFSGTITDINGNPLHGTVGVTFLMYKEQNSLAPLWLETQNVQVDEDGRYAVMLGATKSGGLPTDLFVSGEARWLGVQAEGQTEQPRILLLSVPYALKAGDAQTLGGLPASAFMQAKSQSTASTEKPVPSTAASSSAKNLPPANPAVTGIGTAGFIPVWDSASDIVNSVLFQKTSQIGVNTASPVATLDVNGKAVVRDTLTLLPKSTDNTLAINGTTFKIDPAGKVTFVAGQTFPGAGTITAVNTPTGSGLSGGGTSGALSLRIAAAGVTNAMLASPKVTLNANAAGGLTTPGAMTLGGTYTIGLKPCTVTQILQYSGTAWNCSSAGTGTITGVTTGTASGLTGGGTSGTLNLSVANAGITNSMLQHPGLTVAAGTGLTGGGAVTLGATTTLNVNTSLIPQLNAANTFSQPLTVNGTSSSAAALNATNPSGTGVYGNASGTNGNGVQGQFSTSSQFSGVTAVGVWGDSSGGSGVYGTSDTGFGVLGASSSSTGLYGQSGTSSAVYGYSLGGQGVNGYSADYVGTYGQYNSGSQTGFGFTASGVWGDTGVPGSFGVLGTTDDGNSFWGRNNTVNHETLYLENDSGPSNGHVPLAARFAGPGSATWCEIYMDTFNNSVGDLLCTGTKSAAVAVDGNRMVRLYAMEAAENWFEDAGSAQLVNGKAAIRLEQLFAQTVNGDVDYHVFLTPNGDCEGLFVASKGAGGFEVRELHRGHSNISFDYRIMARRKGYENVRMEDVTAHFELARKNAQELQQKVDAARASHKDPRQRLAPPALKRSGTRQTAGAVPSQIAVRQ